jgi:hypothetical protein
VTTRLLSYAGGLLFAVALLGGLYLLGRSHGAEGVRVQWQAERLALAEAATRANAEARRIEAERQKAAEDADAKYRTDLAKSRRTAGAAAAELGRLRDELAARDRRAAEAAAAAGSVDGGAAERQLLGECADRYRAVAGDADQLADQVRWLQGFIRGLQ